MPIAWVMMAKGFEEMELVITVDVLRRAGVQVKTVSLGAKPDPVVGSRDIFLVPDTTLEAVANETCDLIVLPGGIDGTKNLAADQRVIDLVRRLAAEGKKVAAICAAPMVLLKAGLLDGRQVTSHPAVAAQMTGVVYQRHRVVVDGNIVTSRAAGTTFEFAFQLVELLMGKENVRDVNKGVLALLPDQLTELLGVS